ncbi:Cobyric acid synthase [Candidatus Johnevansia muelleri]|uniref:Cobyric acid synthase n=1 Tax=Candidatus Johnevansia muelleri TaxID=1495769 RepID=A0A078KIF8_9GAMM|nr:Cobyric acid synthase [Candidatus Evansia muelleri]
MIQGTTSNAGKSVIITAICRILSIQGFQVAPFKSQNMSLNSAITINGGEISRAQLIQSIAAQVPAINDFNPILIKPESENKNQIIVNGNFFFNINGYYYQILKHNFKYLIIQAFNRLKHTYDFILIEGAGSPAEINLRKNDIVNMGLAEAIDCPVILVADINSGGVFAHIIGTLNLLSHSEKKRIIGLIINKFRGDLSIIKSGLNWLEKYTGKPVIAVIPYLYNLNIEAEDELVYNINKKILFIKIIILLFPKISNATDFDVLYLYPKINLYFAINPNEISIINLIILPGSKNIFTDLIWLINKGWHEYIIKHLQYGGKLIGICGGFQILGKNIIDPLGIEGNYMIIKKGLSLFKNSTVITKKKKLIKIYGYCLLNKTYNYVNGYEIHLGITLNEITDFTKSVFLMEEGQYIDGKISHNNQILGSYIHGLFNKLDIYKNILYWVGLKINNSLNYLSIREKEINRFSKHVKYFLYFEKIINILNIY